MEKMSLVSVVVPVYNVERYLPNCVDSIVNQTYQNLEIILVDDGSTDRSGTFCDALSSRDERIRTIHKENEGLSSARNAGTREARGKFIMYIDSDDQVDRRIIELLLKDMVETQSDVAVCDPVHVFKKGDLSYTVDQRRRIFDSESAICEMWYQKSFLPSAWGKLYRTELIKGVEFRTGILYEDIDMMHKVFSHARKIVYNPSKLYAYQHREGSITMQKFSKKDCEILNICDRLKEFSANETLRLQKAAKAYGVVGALRVELNAPHVEAFIEERKRARACIDADWREVLCDRNVRVKTKVGLILYKTCKPFMMCVYSQINRWKQ